MATRYIAVLGTHGYGTGRPRWVDPGSAWTAMMRAEGFEPARPRPFAWSTDLDGLWPWRKHATWDATAENFVDYVAPLAGQKLHVIVHSHGLQPIAKAVAYHGIELATLTSVCSPIRGDVAYALAAPRIGWWQHVYDRSGSDWWQVLGGIGDAVLGVRRTTDHAHRTIPLSDIGHTGLFTNPAVFCRWSPLLEAIRRRDA